MIGLLATIVDWKEVHEMEHDCVIIANAVFKKDFFPWRKGDKAEILQMVCLDNMETWIEELKGDGTTVQKVQVMLISSMSDTTNLKFKAKRYV